MGGSGAGIKVLIIDDDSSILSSLRLNLEYAGYDVVTADSGSVALALVQREKPQVVVSDLSLSDISGFELLRQLRKILPEAFILAMSGLRDDQTRNYSLECGADDFLGKPFEFSLLMELFQRLKQCSPSISVPLDNFCGIIAASQQMMSVIHTLKRLSGYETTVLITGESGTGKELVARAIHQNSPRSKRPFVAINCGAIPENLMESELFGHQKGAFTDAIRDKPGLLTEAAGGTVFLDEIGEMPPHLQVKLLRALQERKIRPVGSEELLDIDVRIIAATLRDLESDVLDGRFREDLFYRLNVVTIHIPALRERPQDVELLTSHFLKKHGERLGIKGKRFNPDAMKALMEYQWRGNVRELENCVERSLVLSETDEIFRDILPQHVLTGVSMGERSERQDEFPESNLSIKQRGRALEISLITKALKRTGGNRTQAAKILEISHRALLYKLKEYGLAQ